VLIVASLLEAKTYKLINLTTHKKLNIQVQIEGPGCSRQMNNYDLEQKESAEIIVSRRCLLDSIHIMPLYDIPNEEIIKVKNNDATVETIAIKHAAHGYKLTYY
jgi:Fe-S cluster assembly iron-binding protein IscA